MKKWLQRALTWHWFTTLLILAISGLAFGIFTYNLFELIRANVALIAEHGMQALMDGALMQLTELVAYGLLGAIAYTILKACERVLVDKMLR